MCVCVWVEGDALCCWVQSVSPTQYRTEPSSCFASCNRHLAFGRSLSMHRSCTTMWSQLRFEETSLLACPLLWSM